MEVYKLQHSCRLRFRDKKLERLEKRRVIRFKDSTMN
nr:MAG TPA: hypothetical protein [Caudoviricetes sp.]